MKTKVKNEDGELLTDAGAMQVLLDGGYVRRVRTESFSFKVLSLDKTWCRLNGRTGQLVNSHGDPSPYSFCDSSTFGEPNRRWRQISKYVAEKLKREFSAEVKAMSKKLEAERLKS